MDRSNSKAFIFFRKILIKLTTPIQRLRKIVRKSNMRQVKFSATVIAIIISVATVTYLYRLSIAVMHQNVKSTPKSPIGTPFKHMPLDEIYKDFRTEKIDQDYLFGFKEEYDANIVNTPGCKIPFAVVDYGKYLSKNAKNKRASVGCGNRAVFLRKVGDDQVIARIKPRILEKYAKNKKLIGCCYQFIIDILQYPHEHPTVIFNNCTYFIEESLITLQSDFINIKCTANDSNSNITHIIYDDMYAFSKKLNESTPNRDRLKLRYNILMVGMDSMSLPRAVKTLPRTTTFFKNDRWLGFSGYNKIADNTFPNLMAVLTGKNLSSITKECAGKMDDCNDLFVWSAFKEVGYVTAYGEDYLQLPDTFVKEYEFREPPTDHYMKPFFLKGEFKRQSNSLVCAGKAPSGKQILDYALDFANTYKTDSFFGLFWINSFSHDIRSRPEDADIILENFFNQLTYTGILANTFIIFFSDHGVRFGGHRFKMESYYDDRLPMNFMWVPIYFKEKHYYEIRALSINQHRLVTPYDVYSTLLDIKKASLQGNDTDLAPEGCPNCHSMFEPINSNRTCQDAAIHDKWCSCHKLYPLPIQDPIGINSVHHVLNYIKTMVKAIETQKCWDCLTLSMQKIIRIHFYYDRNRVDIFYVVAFTMTPGNMTYEATVLRKGKKYGYEIVGPISVISNYRGLGQCALNRRDRLFCICQKIENC